MANYNYCTNATALDATAKLISLSLPRRCMVSYKSCTDATMLKTSAKLEKSTTHHDDGAWQTTVDGTDDLAPDAKAKLEISMNCNDDNGGRPKQRCFGAATSEERAKLPKKERIRTSSECEDIVEWLRLD